MKMNTILLIGNEMLNIFLLTYFLAKCHIFQEKSKKTFLGAQTFFMRKLQKAVSEE